DQGGCVETSKPTTHSQPTYIIDDVVHYCVTNMPGAVGRTSTYALTNVTLPYVLQLAKKGFERAVDANPALKAGVNIHKGKVTNAAVAEAFDLECVSVGPLPGAPGATADPAAPHFRIVLSGIAFASSSAETAGGVCRFTDKGEEPCAGQSARWPWPC